MLLTVGDHLWQSTLCGLTAALLTLAFRRHRADVRYWLWLGASLKFLVPFSLLAALGSQFDRTAPMSVTELEWTTWMDTASQPLTFGGVSLPRPLTSRAPLAAGLSVQTLLFWIWLAGAALVLCVWMVRWRRVARLTRAAVHETKGRHVEAIGRVAGSRPAPPLFVSEAAMEPGVFGVFRPVLLWPKGIDSYLSEEQADAIFAHEMAHVRRGDNLTASLHMIVQAMCWFHPLVWWIGGRLVDERERACDEATIREGHSPHAYAEGLLKTCRFCADAPAMFVAGVAGSNLTTRIERIMKRSLGIPVRRWGGLVLAASVVGVVGAPVVVGALNAPRVAAQAPNAAAAQAFEAATITPNKSGAPTGLTVLPGGRLRATSVPARALIQQAYKIHPFQLVDIPEWVTNERYDLMAVAGGDVSIDQMKPLLQQLLAERFKLVVHRETREMPIYALVRARRDGTLGPALARAPAACAAVAEAAGRDRQAANAPQQSRVPCEIRGAGIGKLVAHGVGIDALAAILSVSVGRIVLDKTGLTGGFDFELAWTPDQLARGAAPLPSGIVLPNVNPDGPSIFTAVQEQLGLKLDAQQGPAEVLVIDRIERPTEN